MSLFVNIYGVDENLIEENVAFEDLGDEMEDVREQLLANWDARIYVGGFEIAYVELTERTKERLEDWATDVLP